MTIKTSLAINQEEVEGVDCQKEYVLKWKKRTVWQRQETMALLTIRSKMDAAFCDGIYKDYSEDVSRQLAEQGYRKTPKQCLKKFHNIHASYNSKIKEGRANFQDQEIYNFFSQLKALHGCARASITTLPLQPSDEVKGSFSLEANGDEKAPESAFDVTENANSFLVREEEYRLPLMDISLPFIKKSHLWGKFESMEVFQLMPQVPHFHPLKKENEERREGLALGHMLSFVNLKDKTCKVHIEDSRSMFENKLNALTDLEELGFTVQLIRSRLEELLRIKDRYDQLDDESKAAEGEILNEKRQVDEIEESITGSNMQAQELLMEKERKCYNIGELQRMADLIKEKLQNARLDFDNLVAASW